MGYIYKEVEELVTRRVVVKRICDKCGDEIIERREDLSHDFVTFTLEFSEGTSLAYNGGTFSRGFEVEDLCIDCANELKHILIENGIKVKEWDD